MNTNRTTADGDGEPLGLIGGIGLTEINVYAQRPGPDGRFGGCPHVHAVTDEGYFVLAGTGRAEFHDAENGPRGLDLGPGDYVHFPPLVLHRLVSDGDLVILGMMGNAGLAERGEARIYFGREVDADAAEFARLVGLARRHGLDGALDRRDAAVAGYLRLVALWQSDGDAYFAELRRFVAGHCAAMAERRQELARQIDLGPLAWGRATRGRVERLPAVPPVAPEVRLSRRGGEAALGMCGVLRPILRLDRLGTARP